MTGLNWPVGERRREKRETFQTQTQTQFVRYEANAAEFSSASCPRPTTTLSHQLTGSDLLTPISSSHAVTELDAMRKERKNKIIKLESEQLCLELLNQPTLGPRTCSSDFMQQLMAEAVVLRGESVPLPFCSSSCHWECGQQRAA